MGSALARAVFAVDNTEIYVYDKDLSRGSAFASEIGASASTVKEIGEKCDFIFIGVKPNIVPAVCKELDAIAFGMKDAVLVSMAAGVEIASIESSFSKKVNIIRIMPNTPVSIGRGMIEWCATDGLSADSEAEFERLMSETGRLDKIPERLIDAASAVAGCGPAFVFMCIEALADGGVKCGLARDKALIYAAETLRGAAELLISSERHPEDLKDAVCSPGGSTIAGVAALEEGAFRSSLIKAVEAAYNRTLELGK
jgi:pyrroline-5-carboxylate reductase